MIGIVIVTHASLGQALREAVEFIAGKQEQVEVVGQGVSDPPQVSSEQLKAAIKKVDAGEGVLILTDMFGGTPSNVSLAFLEPERVEVLSGVNLPMLLKMVTSRQNRLGVVELAHELKAAGRQNISLASEIMAPGKKTEKSQVG
ncbi:MAG: PTS sugar transporter subunit IIA [Deltaproteobacteria bacterium]|nr:PTS sugar transporter subunit IIA [Deltaproteobacteria bacterium]